MKKDKVNMLRYTILVFLFLGISFSVQSQTILNEKANKAYKRFNYKRAIEYYEASLAIDSANLHLLRCLADSYDKVENDKQAECIYKLLIENSNHSDNDLLNYAVFIKNRGNYKQAKKSLEEYVSRNKNDLSALQLLDEVNQNIKEVLLEMQGKVSHLNINSEYSEFAPVIINKKLVFTSGRKVSKLNKSKYGWDGQFFLELFEYDLNDKNAEVKLFAKEVRSRYHEGVVCFANDNKTMYLTRNNYLHGKLTRSKDGTSNLKIYISKFKNGKWSELKEFAYNNDEYSIGHPTISSDGNVMYFVSDMPGGYGGTDIYSCKKENGRWSKPKNMGKYINTAQNEMFPFLSSEGNLFFASNGRKGLGGLDLYGLNLNISDAKIIHLAAPLNSDADDFSMVFEEGSAKGYFASNREGGLGQDDLYSFTVEEYNQVIIEVKDSIDQTEIIPDQIIATSSDNESLELVGETSHYSFTMKGGEAFSVKLEKEGYYPIDTILHTHLLQPKTTHVLNMRLLPIIPEENVNFVFKDFDTGNLLSPDVFQIIEPFVRDLLSELEDGSFMMDLEKGIDYRFFAKKDGFYALDFNYSLGQDSVGNKKEFAMRTISRAEKKKEFLPEDLSTVYFDFDKAIVKNEAFEGIDKVIEILKNNENLMVTLVARADTRGESAYNKYLANKRAEATRKFFIDSNIDPDRVVILALGDTSPFEKKEGESMKEWYRLNRCVDFQLNTIFKKDKEEEELVF
ncbi:MAG: OmpA family protein [Labilibaculum sp.]|nr:OmpA family protein [Labilibaculum sp.]MBI9059813.1 OmpA family protein [Labilibaculum sp.]